MLLSNQNISSHKNCVSNAALRKKKFLFFNKIFIFIKKLYRFWSLTFKLFLFLDTDFLSLIFILFILDISLWYNII